MVNWGTNDKPYQPPSGGSAIAWGANDKPADIDPGVVAAGVAGDRDRAEHPIMSSIRSLVDSITGNELPAVNPNSNTPDTYVSTPAAIGRQFVAGGGDVLNAVHGLAGLFNPSIPINEAMATRQLNDANLPAAIKQGIADQINPIGASARSAQQFGNLGPNEQLASPGLGGVGSTVARVVPTLAAAIATGGGGAAELPAAVTSIPVVGRVATGLAGGAVPAATMTGIQASNQDMSPGDVAKSFGLNLALAGLPGAVGTTTADRLLTGGAIGVGQNEIAGAVNGQKPTTQEDIAQGIIGAVLGGAHPGPGGQRSARDQRAYQDIIDNLNRPQPEAPQPDVATAPVQPAVIAAPPVAPLALPAPPVRPGELPAPSLVAGSDGTVRTTDQQNQVIQQAGADQASRDARIQELQNLGLSPQLAQLISTDPRSGQPAPAPPAPRPPIEGTLDTPALPAPAIAVSPTGEARTSEQQGQVAQQAVADQQAALDAAQDRRNLGMTPDVERAQAVRFGQNDKVVSPEDVPEADIGNPITEKNQSPALPEGLEPSTDGSGTPASWVIRNKETGKSIMETMNPEVAGAINREKYEAVPILRHMSDVQRSIDNGGDGGGPYPKEPAFSFAGERAQTADHGALSRAQDMEAMGRDMVERPDGTRFGSPEDTHEATGWHRGTDGKWRFEIDDSSATIKPTPSWEATARAGGASLPEVLDHPAMLDAYPALADARVKIEPGMSSLGAYNPADNTVTIRDPASYQAKGDGSLKSVVVHELQHAIQSQEGFARGGSSAEFAQPMIDRRNALLARRKTIQRMQGEARDAGDTAREYQLQKQMASVDRDLTQEGLLKPEAIQTKAGQSYRGLAGEVEARNTQRRLDLTAEERRAQPPTETEDVPRSKQNVRFNPDTAERRSALENTSADEKATQDLSERLTDIAGGQVRLTLADAVPDATRRALDEFDRAFGGKTVVVHNETPDVIDFQGVTQRGNERFVADNAAAPMTTVAAHEMIHQLRATDGDLYDELAEYVTANADTAGYRAMLEKGNPVKVGEKAAHEELVADLVGDSMADPEFLDRMAQRNPALFAKVAAYLKDALASIMAKLRNLGSAKYIGREELEAFRQKLEDVLERYATRQQERAQPRNAASEGERMEPVAFSRRQYTPEQDEFLKKAGLGEEPSTIAKLRETMAGITEAGKNLATQTGRQELSDRFTQSTTDRLHGLKVAERGKGITPDSSAYVAARLATGAPAVTSHVLENGGIKWGDQASAQNDPSVKGLIEAIAPVRKDLNDWLAWRVATRAQRLMTEGRENLFTQDDINAGLSLALGREADFRQAADDFAALNKNVLDFMEKAGTINPETRALWENPDYIPFNRVRDDGDVVGPGTTKGLAGQKKPIKQLKGGTNQLNDPLANIAQNWASGIAGALNNNAALMAIKNNPDMFEKAPMQQEPALISLSQVKKTLLERGVSPAQVKALGPEALRGYQQMMQTVPPTGEDVIRVLDGGKPKYYRVDDPLMYRALTGMQDHDRSWLTKLFGMFKNALTAGVTLTPRFAVANLLRDTGEAWITSGVNFKPVASSVLGAIKHIRNDPDAQAIMASGSGFHGGLYQQGKADATARVIRRALRHHGHDQVYIERFMKTVVNPMELFRKYQELLEAAESGSRIAVYNALRDRGASNAEAALAAKDLLDFSKRGDSKILGWFLDTIAFLNARIQGLSRLVRTGKGEDVMGNKNPKLRRIFFRRLLTMAAMSSVLYAINQQRYGEAYDNLEEWDKDTYWHFFPGTPYHFRVPKPFELGLVGGTLPERMLGGIKHAMKEGGDDAKALWDSLTRAITQTLEIGPPTLLTPALEEYANHNMFTGRPIENEADQKLLPGERSSYYTSDTAQALGRAAGVSPKRIEHLVNGYLGGVGTSMLHGADWMVRKATGAPERPEAALRDFPVLGSFLRGDNPSPNTRNLTRFYDNTNKAGQVADTIKELLVRADTRGDADAEARAKKLYQENKAILGDIVTSRSAKAGIQFSAVQQATRVQNYLADIRKQNDQIALSRDLNPTEKRDQINANIQKRDELVNDFVRGKDVAIPKVRKQRQASKASVIEDAGDE